jgi:diguanylate cyclase (GGDEF)-like protein
MWIERALRRLSVGKRMTLAALVLVVPMSVLIAVTVVVLEQQETALHRAISESVNTLMPLATLEYDLQRALTDELDAESGEAMPDYGGLTGSIDRLFAQLRSKESDADVPADSIESALTAWSSARPAVERLVEHVTPLRVDGDRPSSSEVRDELRRAVRDVEQARIHLARAVKARATTTAAAQQRQLSLLVWSWAATLLVASAILAAIVYSIVRPSRELGRAVQRLGRGDLSVRLDGSARDELGAVAVYLNAMASRFATRKQVLESEAHQDALTRLPNRRAVLAALESASAASANTGEPVSVLMIDVDHFKQVNDRFGHAAGDAALQWLAKQMRETLRERDVLGRYAGDEFLVVLPGASREQALGIAERLSTDAREAAAADPRKPSITIGVATSDGNTEAADALIDAADQALYQGKSFGRARVMAL